MRSFWNRLKPGEHKKATAKEAMDDLLTQMGFDPTKYALFDIWEKEVRGLIKGCDAVAIQGTRLYVRVPSTVHRQELMYSKARLIKKINQAMGKTAVTDIKFELSSTENWTTKKTDKGGTLRGENPRWNRRFRQRDG